MKPERLQLGGFERSSRVVVTLNPPLRMRHRLVRRGFTLPKVRPERLLLVMGWTPPDCIDVR